MTRNFYSYAIFFTVLFIVISIFQTIIIYFQPATPVRELQSLTGWLACSYLIAIIWSLILLKYYHHKQYALTFWVMAISIAASLFQFMTLIHLLTVMEYTMYYILSTFLLLGTGIVYGLSLIFSAAGQRRWLKAAGVFLFIVGAVSMLSLICALTFRDLVLNGTIAKVEQWTSLIASVGPVLFVMNFWNERKETANVNTASQETWDSLLGLIAFIAVASSLFFGHKVTIESLTLAANPNKVSQNLKLLAEPFEARTYVDSDGDTLRYRFMKPLDYDSTKEYPLLVCLHGGSGRGTDNVRQVATSFPTQLLSMKENRAKYPAFLLVPQCPPRSCWGGIPDLPAVDSLVFETIDALEKEFTIDASRRYVTGHSLGGYGAWHFISARPEMFAAAVPLSGGGNPDFFREVVDIPVWAFHGAKDLNVPVSGSRDIIEAIKNAGGDPRYTEFQNEGHHIWQNVTDTPALLDWLFAQKRDRDPQD